MKNLKLKLALVALLFSSTGLFAQGFYISANAGYSFAMNGQRGFNSNTHRESVYDNIGNNSSSTFTEESVNYSYGKGFNFGGAIGFEFNDYLGVELGLDYLYGGKNTTKNMGSYTDISPSGTTVDLYSNSSSSYSRMFRVIPRLVISPNFEKLNPYIKVGVVLGFGSFYSDSESENTFTLHQDHTSSISRKSYGGIAIGFNSSLGVNYKLSDKICLFGEMSYIGMSYAPEKTSVTKWEENGEDVLSSKPISFTEWEYVDELTKVQNSNNEDEPSKGLYFSQPFSSLGINFGVKFNLNPAK